MMSDNNEKIFEAVKDVPPMPQVASKVISILENPDFSFAELVRVISKDASVAANILKMANSALFAPKNDITNLTQAISFLGVKNVKNLVITLSTKSLFSKSSTSLFDNKIWEHSIATAIFSRILALNIDKKIAEEAFLTGLMHDLGQMIMLKNLPDYENILTDAFNENASVVDIENDILGFSHSEVGAYLMDKWNLPAIYKEGIAFHHAPEKSDESLLANIVCYAHNFAKSSDIGITKNLDSFFSEGKFNIDGETLEDCKSYFFEIFDNEKDIFKI